jgi:hypothetical protein
MTPPRIPEALLASLGAPVDFRDPLLGDLAEEYALREERDGASSASQWYVAQTIRCAPHLLGAWARSAGWDEVRRLGGIVLLTYVLTAIVVMLLEGMAWGASGALGITLHMPRPGQVPALFWALGLTFGATMAVMVGAIAAWLDRETPVLSALASGVVWGGIVGTAMVATGAPGMPLWYRVCAPTVMLLGPAVGGVLRVRAMERAPSHAQAPMKRR